MNENFRRNFFTFGIGTIGRDMVYPLVAMYLMNYLTDALNLADSTMWWIVAIMVLARVFDAINDPYMGTLVDSTHSRWGKFKPWIFLGAILAGIFTILLFVDFGLTGAAFVLVFGLIYLLWGITFTMNDISYWSMLPSLSVDQKQREKIGAFARICANIGLFTIVALIVPLTTAVEEATGSLARGFLYVAIGVVIVMWLGQLVTLIGVKEPNIVNEPTKKMTLKDLGSAIFKNDQLLVLALSMSLFMIGYVTTTSFGLYYFTYAFGDKDMYTMFALVLGASQLIAIGFFPFLTKRFTRNQLYLFGTAFVIVGYVLFFIAPMTMLVIGPAGMFLFIGQAFIQMLMLMFLADSIEYGQWKLGQRNESITFSIQPFINKIGGAIGSGIVLATAILIGINRENETLSVVTDDGILFMKIMMMIVPLILIVASFIIYKKKFIIDEKLYATIIKDLKERGELEIAPEELEQIEQASTI